MKRTRILMTKSVYLVLSLLEINEIVMWKFWYCYEKPKYRGKGKLCYMDRDTFIVYIKYRTFK